MPHIPVFVIEVTPSNKSFPKHIWKEGGVMINKNSAEFQANQMRDMINLSGKGKFYSKVEVIPLPLS